jgi:2-phosphosulfolactate phosphatase
MSRVTIYETKERIPEPVPDGIYVIIDVFRFSTSVITFLEEGARHVTAAQTLAEAREYKRQNAEAMVGGEPHNSDDLFEVMNSPTHIRETDVRDKPVCLFSENGAWTVERTRHGNDVYIATSWNLTAVSDHLSDREDEDIYLVATGANDEVRYEDLSVAVALKRSIDDDFAAESEPELYRLAIEGVNARHSTSGRDKADAELLTEFDRSGMVPRLNDEGRIVAE